ncbi:MAG TPA: hypothetical protein VFQ61_09305 [Polyangiaceae bacterium]|nr:hypothetical protein [Polyangiaceae bacterium]
MVGSSAVYATQLTAQMAANRSALPYYAAFGTHRERLSSRILAAERSLTQNADQLSALKSERATAKEPRRTLCVLGAGNGYDLDFPLLHTRFAEMHLVDLDADALRRCHDRQEPRIQAALGLHAGLDLSGMLDRLERWRRMQVTPQELMNHAEGTARALRVALGRSFDVVVSACMLSQMQLTLLEALGAEHRLFEAARMTLTLTHLRALGALLAPGGVAVFATDVSAEGILPSGALAPFETASELDRGELVRDLARRGHVFHFADPERVLELIREDPVLHRNFSSSDVTDAWVWQNGSAGKFLVYSLELRNRVL